MAKEYKGGLYVFFEYIGLYIRYFLCKLFRRDKTLSELSGEKDYPNIDKRERIICLVVGIIAIVLLFLIVSLLCFPKF